MKLFLKLKINKAKKTISNNKIGRFIKFRTNITKVQYLVYATQQKSILFNKLFIGI